MHAISLDREQQQVEAQLMLLSKKLCQTIRYAAAYHVLLKRWPFQPGIYLWGTVGRGKTLLMDRFFDSLPFAQKKRMHFHAWMRLIHQELEKERSHPNPLERIIAKISKSTRVFCLDEFLVSDIGDAMILSGLLNALMKKGVTVVATSNTPPEKLYWEGLQRHRFLAAIQLISSMTQVIEMGPGQDYRLKVLQEATVYWDSSKKDTEAQMLSVFQQLSANHLGETQVALKIMDRPVLAKRVYEGIVWFDFSILCQSARSVADYLEIAELYHTVFVSNIPPLSPEAEESAKRFIHLVDTLYDQHVTLLLSSALPIEQLYQGQRWQSEFKRTISRLTEMKSLQYQRG